MADNATVAASYAEDHGWAVFPVQPASKDPYRGSRGFKDASCDPARVRWMFGRVSPESNVGLSCGAPSGGLVVIDEDNKDGECGADTIHDWEAEHGELPETVTCCTPTGGMHRYYRVDREVRPSVNKELGIDIRGDGSYALLPPSVHPDTGTAYEWEFAPDEREVADADENVYAFIEHVRPKEQAPGKPRRNTGRIEKGGRNDELFRRGRSMLAKSPGADYDLVLAYLMGVNAIDCAEPLPEHEVEKIAASVCTVKPGMSDEAKAKQAEKQDKRKFKHNEVARKLMTERGACFIDGMPAVRVGGYYRAGWEHVDGAVIDMHDDSSSHNQREVRHYLMVKAPRVAQSRPELVAFANGVLDMETMELRDPRPDDVIPNVIPHRWNPDAESKDVVNALRKMAAGDDGTLDNLGEVIGLCMFRSARYGYCPILLGGGSNGKSTYIDMLHAVIGTENMSALQPREIGQRFQAAQLVGKLANLGDDISNDYIDADSCATIKKVATGSTIYTDVKGGDGFNFEPYCTMVFSANEFPRLGDSSYGMRRRLFPIAFNAKFSADDPDFDPNIKEKLTSEKACEYLCKVGVYSMLNVIRAGKMTDNAESRRIIERIQVDNSTVLQWMEDLGLDAEYAVGMTAGELYSDYQEWCRRSGVQWIGSRRFSNLVCGTWHLKTSKIDHATIKGRRVTIKRYEIQQ